jgi:hypothetical protein
MKSIISILSPLLIARAFAQETSGGSPAPSATLEIAEFRLVAGAREPEFLAASRGLDAFLAGCAGFVSRSLVRFDDGRLADVVLWKSRAAAEGAMQVAGKDARAAAYFAFIAEDSVTMRHAAVIDTGVR